MPTRSDGESQEISEGSVSFSRITRALSMGKTIISTSPILLPFNHIFEKRAVWVEDDPINFMKGMNTLWEDENARDTLAKRSLEYYQDELSFKSAIQKFEKIVHRTIKGS